MVWEGRISTLRIWKEGVLEVAITFSGSELINIAIGIERRGIAFYDTMARSTENAEARDIFQYLADMERTHIHIFQVNSVH